MFPEIEAAAEAEAAAAAAAAAAVSRSEFVETEGGVTIHSTMKPAMYFAAKEGDVAYLASRTDAAQYGSYLTPDKNTILHIAIRFERLEFASHALRREPSLLFQANSKGDTPLHVAARLPNTAAAELLAMCYSSTDLESGQIVPQWPMSDSQWWMAANSEGNTALHEALICRNGGTAILLLSKEPGLANCVNNCNESPLYLAASFGFVEVVERILNIGTTRDISLGGPNGQTPLHAVAMMIVKDLDGPNGQTPRHAVTMMIEAVAMMIAKGLQGPNGQTSLHAVAMMFARGKGTVTLRNAIGRLLCKKLGNSVIRKVDKFGRTALHYSAATPATGISEILLQADHTLAYVSDNNGHTPLVIAALLKHNRIFNIILKYCPDCGEICNLNGENVFHSVIREGSLTYTISDHPELKHLFNEKDNRGNTPLHMAAKAHKLNGIRNILFHKGVNLIATNKEGLTALDIVESWASITSKSSRAKMRLVCSGAARRLKMTGEKARVTPTPPLKETKQLANTLLVVATLTATITFATVFQLPGGYSSDQPGSALFSKKAAFIIFMLSDAFALCSSMICIFFLVWGLLSGGESCVRTAVVNVSRLLSYTYLMTMVAFTSAAYLVIEKESMWLAILILLMCCGVPMINKLQWILFPRYHRSRVSNKYAH